MKKQLLLIEDDKIVRENTAEILQFANYDVITASNGKIGVEKAQEHLPDLIVCDIMMPKLDGYAVYKILSKDTNCEKIPFIFLTAKTNHIDRRKAMELGADDYLTKPFAESELLGAIEIRLKKRTLNNPLPNHTIPNNKSLLKFKNLEKLIESMCNRPISSYEKGDTLYCAGNKSNHVFLVKSGTVKTFRNTESGKELITGLYKKRQFIGYTSSMGDFPYKENAEALEELKLIKIDKIEVREILNSNPHIALDLLKMISDNIDSIKNKMLQMAYSSVRSRVAKILLMVIEDNPLNKILISRTDLASLTGIAKETLIRTLADFREDGLVETNRTYINIIDLEKLKKIR